MILAADVGGTKTHLALFDWHDGRVEPTCIQTFSSTDFGSFQDLLGEFLRGSEVHPEPTSDPPSAPGRLVINVAAIGIAGPVVDNRCQTTNLPWVVDGGQLAESFEIKIVRLLNDLEAMAHGLLVLRPEEMLVLNAGSPPKTKGAIALIAAGTGLGEGILFWDGDRYRPRPSEGGHADFAPTSDLEIELLRHLRMIHLHVSYERVLSGPGLVSIYEFLRDTKKNEPTWLAERLRTGDPAPIIAEVGLAKQAALAVETLDLFTSIYGAEAGNLALKALALDGVYIGGGIGPKLREKLEEGGFMRAFTNKGRYKRLMSSIPVRLIMNQHAGLLGAAAVAATLARGGVV